MTKLSRLLVGPLAAIGATGCLASKGDIRLLQDELVATHAAIARSDSLHQRQIDSLTAALAASASAAARADSALQRSIKQTQQSQQATDAKLGELSTREHNDQLATSDKLKALVDEVNQVQEFTRQNAHAVTQAKAEAEKAVAATTALPPVQGDTNARGSTPAQPGPASLLLDGNGAILQGSCRAARRSYEEYLRLYPNGQEAPEVQYKIAESFVSCPEGGNPAAADSVYSLVTAKYPKSDFAAIALYKQAEMQARNNKPDSARSLFQRIVCEYPKSTVFGAASDKAGVTKSCK